MFWQDWQPRPPAVLYSRTCIKRRCFKKREREREREERGVKNWLKCCFQALFYCSYLVLVVASIVDAWVAKTALIVVLQLLGKFGDSCFAGLKDKQHWRFSHLDQWLPLQTRDQEEPCRTAPSVEMSLEALGTTSPTARIGREETILCTLPRRP